MVVPRVLPLVVGVAAMAGLVGSVAPVAVRLLPVSTVDEPVVGQEWAGAPLAAFTRQLERWQREAALTARLAAIDNGSVDLAVAALDRGTGRTYGYAATKQFRTASIVKVDILASLLLQANRKGRSLTTAERRLASEMIRRSDNDAASTLWGRTGGIGALGLTATRQGSDGDWGETTTTAGDQLALLRKLADGAIPDSGYVLDLMAGVVSDQDWGVSAAAAPGERTALKNGWFPASGGWILNSMGRITDADTDLLLVVLSRGHASYPSGVRAVEEVAAAVREGLT